MRYEIAWLLLSFAIMVVAVLVNVHEKIQRLEEQVSQLTRDGAEDRASERQRGW